MASYHVHPIQDKNDLQETKNSGTKTSKAQKPDNLPTKAGTGFEGSRKLQNNFYKITEKRERREKFEIQATTNVRKRSHMSYSVLKSVQVASPNVHQIGYENNFIDSKNPEAKTSNDKKPMTKSKKPKQALKESIILKKNL